MTTRARPIRRAILALSLFCSFGSAAPAQAQPVKTVGDPLPLRVLYVGELDSPRGKAFDGFLRRHFASVRTAPVTPPSCGRS